MFYNCCCFCYSFIFRYVKYVILVKGVAASMCIHMMVKSGKKRIYQKNTCWILCNIQKNQRAYCNVFPCIVLTFYLICLIFFLDLSIKWHITWSIYAVFTVFIYFPFEETYFSFLKATWTPAVPPSAAASRDQLSLIWPSFCSLWAFFDTHGVTMADAFYLT